MYFAYHAWTGIIVCFFNIERWLSEYRYISCCPLFIHSIQCKRLLTTIPVEWFQRNLLTREFKWKTSFFCLHSLNLFFSSFLYANTTRQWSWWRRYRRRHSFLTNFYNTRLHWNIHIVWSVLIILYLFLYFAYVYTYIYSIHLYPSF